jgi:hypothetical protein
MSLLALFSAPKPFTDPRIALIQNNAIASWAELSDVEVFLLGDDQGVAEAALQFGVRHLREVERNESGTPLVSSMVRLTRENCGSSLLCIINADMIVMSDLVDAARQVVGLGSQFVLLGQRWDLDMNTPLHFTDGWEQALRARVSAQGVLHRPAGSDFFVFPRDGYADLPEFAVGRAGWDNWMIYRARQLRWRVIDGTPSITMVHQNHEYGHLPGGAPHYAAPESNENIRLAGGEGPIRYTVIDATDTLSEGRLARPRPSYLRFMRSIELALRAIFFFLPANLIEEVARPKRWKRRVLRLLGRK